MNDKWTYIIHYMYTKSESKPKYFLSPSRILLYYGGASFNITMSKLVNSPFKEAIWKGYGSKQLIPDCLREGCLDQHFTEFYYLLLILLKDPPPHTHTHTQTLGLVLWFNDIFLKIQKCLWLRLCKSGGKS